MGHQHARTPSCLPCLGPPTALAPSRAEPRPCASRAGEPGSLAACKTFLVRSGWALVPQAPRALRCRCSLLRGAQSRAARLPSMSGPQTARHPSPGVAAGGLWGTRGARPRGFDSLARKTGSGHRAELPVPRPLPLPRRPPGAPILRCWGPPLSTPTSGWGLLGPVIGKGVAAGTSPSRSGVPAAAWCRGSGRANGRLSPSQP